ncbi:MAG TPA: MFS transporter [Nocardioidaceae bacterium]|nr:MFS transporter [Nocardioidaceae bacterium]
MRLPEGLAPLRQRQFAIYFTGRAISLSGSALAPIALTFAVLDLTGNSATALGWVLAARSVPLVVFLLVGGVVADRFSRSTVLVASHVLSALTQGAVAALLLTGAARLWMVVVIEALNGTFSAFTMPAMQGLIPQVVPRTHLQQANSLLSLVRGGATIVGPSVGGLLVVGLGSGWAIAVDALTWAVAAGFMARLGLPAARSSDLASTSAWRDLRDGWSAFTSYTWLWVVVLAFGALNAIQAGSIFTLGPMIAKQTVGIPAWGYAVSAESLGLLAATVVMLRWRPRYALRAGMIGVGALALPMFVLGLAPATGLLTALMCVAGAGQEVFGITWNTSLQEHVPNQLLSRVSSYDAVGSFVAIPLGELLFGPLAGVWPARDVVLGSGVAYLALVALTLGSRSVRRLERAARQAPQPAEPVPLSP